ncbi:MAG: hypothetical protein KKC68_00985 [Candidatus Thermoplasmatota archaeon]|nr:hypothetical protein [Candidatus Thermoplasmatota archaeon]MBU1940325.1 hypothetical protein [Candidatus Thermoplasmatota archaeon]
MRFEQCVKDRLLIKISPSTDMIQKERWNAEYDLERARNSYDEEDFNGQLCKPIMRCFMQQRPWF